jgi:hypothetical protein
MQKKSLSNQFVTDGNVIGGQKLKNRKKMKRLKRVDLSETLLVEQLEEQRREDLENYLPEQVSISPRKISEEEVSSRKYKISDGKYNLYNFIEMTAEEVQGAHLVFIDRGYTGITTFIIQDVSGPSPNKVTVVFGEKIFSAPSSLVSARATYDGVRKALWTLGLLYDTEFKCYDGLIDIEDMDNRKIFEDHEIILLNTSSTQLVKYLADMKDNQYVADFIHRKYCDLFARCSWDWHVCFELFYVQSLKMDHSQILTSDAFWQKKFVRDYGNVESVVENWQKFYFEEKRLLFVDDRSPNDAKICKLMMLLDKIVSNHDGTRFAIIDTERELFYFDMIGRTDAKFNYERRNIIDVCFMNEYIDGDVLYCIDEWNTVHRLQSGDNREWPAVKAKQISAFGSHGALIDLDDNLCLFGYNLDLQIDTKGIESDKYVLPYRLGVKAKSVVCGNNFTVMIDLNDEVWVIGECGINLLEYDDTKEMGKLCSFPVKRVFAADSAIFVIDKDDFVHAAGVVDAGRLGIRDDGTYIHRCYPLTKLNIQAKDISISERYTVLVDLKDTVWISGFFGGHRWEVDEENYSDQTVFRSTGIKARSVAAGRRMFCGIHTTL